MLTIAPTAGLLAQDRADTLQLLEAAVRGYAPHNGPATELSPRFECLGMRIDRDCTTAGRDSVGDRRLLEELAPRLGLPIPVGPPAALTCGFAADRTTRAQGMRLHLGPPQFAGDSASVGVSVACQGFRGEFAEGCQLSLRRTDTGWVVHPTSRACFIT